MGRTEVSGLRLTASRVTGLGLRLTCDGLGEEVCVEFVLVTGVMLHHETGGGQELPRVPGLLPPDVTQGVVKQLLLEADHCPPIHSLAHAEGGELGETRLYNLRKLKSVSAYHKSNF